jgi:putative hydrolase of the HAD superfamily
MVHEHPYAHALLIDYGGVLTNSVIGGFSTACAAMGVDAEPFIAECFSPDHAGDSPFARLELGQVTMGEFCDQVSPILRKYASAPVDGHRWLKLVQRATRGVDQEMVRAVDALAERGALIALVSNSWGSVDDYPWDRLPAFSDVVVSGRVGLRKPDPRIYQLAAERLGVGTADCVFVDDLEVNLVPARELGMTTILHQRSPDTIGHLSRLFTV